MDSEKAFALRDFINDHSTRFDAEVLPFGSQGDQGWVIVADKAPGSGSADKAPGAGGPRNTFLEPIADPDDYLRRANEGTLEVDEEYRALLQEWLR
jgi:hypothetical protein